MVGMTEKDVIIAKVKKIMDTHLERRFVLYGTGNVSRWVVVHFNDDKDYRIDAIMDFNYSEELFMGYHVFKKDDSNYLTKDDLIIIMNRNPVIAQFIYNRIWQTLPEGALAVSIDGSTFEKPDENDTVGSLKQLSYCEIKKKIDSSNIVSFDIFDTLLTRCVEKPTDVFLLMSEIARKKYGINNFCELRREAEICANKTYISPTINEIYEKLCEIAEIDDKEIAQALVKEEIETEDAILTIRVKNLELLKYCSEMHKEVYLISDTYYKKDIFIHFFELNGIDLLEFVNKDHLLLSCELRKTKENCEMWSYFAGLTVGSKCLHFGDNVITDIKLCKDAGIDAVCTYNSCDLRREAISGTIYNSTSALTSTQLGLFDSIAFNSPFSEGNEINTHYDYGYIILGPVIFNYLYWIFRHELLTHDSDEERRVYFLARDGYFLVRLFNQLSSTFRKKLKGVYLYTSRAFLKYICYEPGSGDKAGFIGSMNDYLKYRFNYEISHDCANEPFIEADDDVDKILTPYINEILKHQKESRKLYNDYLRGIGINKGDNDVSIVDPTYNGTCQYYLSKYANIKSRGYYCVANLSGENRYIGDGCKMDAFYQNSDDSKAVKSLINKYTLVFESSIMVSPEGSMIDIDKTGFVFTPEGKTQEMFDIKEETFRGISKYFDKMCFMIDKFFLFGQEPDNILPQKIFAMSIEGKIKVSDKIKNSLFADDYYNQITDCSVAWR